MDRLRRVILGAAIFLVPAAVVTAQEAASAGSGLTGLIVDTASAPIAYAAVSVVRGTAGVRSDESGRFRLMGLPSGKSLIAVRRLGFDPVFFDVVIPDTSIVDVRVKMLNVAKDLSTVNISDVREPLRRVGFYERMAAGHGHFVSPAMIENRRFTRATDALGSIPNLVVDRRGSKTRVMTSNLKCEYGLVVDGMGVGEAGSRVRTTSPDDLVSASDLYAIEVYPRNRGIPPEFLGMSHEDGCGTIVIWTKGMIAR